jgi:hypothetical protein
MMTDFKYDQQPFCPLMGGRSCIGVDCAWWLEEYRSCAIPRLAMSIRLTLVEIEAMMEETMKKAKELEETKGWR